METDTDTNTTPDTAVHENFGHDMVGVQQLIKVFLRSILFIYKHILCLF